MLPWWLAVRPLVPLTVVRTGTLRRLPAPSASRLAVLPEPVTLTVVRFGKLTTPPDRALTEPLTPAALSVTLVTPGRLTWPPPVAVTLVPSMTVVPVAVNVVPAPWAVSAEPPVIVSAAPICDAPLVTVNDTPERDRADWLFRLSTLMLPPVFVTVRPVSGMTTSSVARGVRCGSQLFGLSQLPPVEDTQMMVSTSRSWLPSVLAAKWGVPP